LGNIDDFQELLAVKPTPLSFRGMPLARWWSLEDRRVDLGQIKRSYLNILTMLLLEYYFIFSQDWYVIPVHPVGTLTIVGLSPCAFGVIPGRIQ
jgi:hypothetical protein